MSYQTHVAHLLAMLAIALVFSDSAQAGATRTFVSTTGNDANTSANCGPSAPCRTFAAALSVTNAGGEIVVLTSGGYGPATISQPIIITAIGVDASISVTTSGGNGITINTPGNVTLIGLNLHGEGTGANGVLVQQVGFLRLYNMFIENFASVDVDFEVSGKLAIYNSMLSSAFAGLQVVNASASVYVEGTAFDANNLGVSIFAGQLTISDSSAEYNATGFSTTGGNLTLFGDRASFNGTALEAGGGGAMVLANCLIANNTAAFLVSGGTMAGTSPGTNLIAPGQTTTGALGTPIALQ